MRLEMGTTDVLPVWLNEPDMPRLKLEAMVIARMHALRSMLGQGSAIYCNLPAAPKPAPTKRKATRKAPMMTGEEFFDARMAACRAIAAECGENWHLVEGASHWASIPSKLRSFTTARGSKCKMHADARLPAARFWAGGVIPEGVIMSPDMPRDRTPIELVRHLARAASVVRLRHEYHSARKRAAYAQTRRDSNGNRPSWTADQRVGDIQYAWATRHELRQAERDAATPCVSLAA